jgi:hypothetical protein
MLLKQEWIKILDMNIMKDIETRYREEQRITIPTPWVQFNDILQGGLGNGDFGLYLVVLVLVNLGH